MRACPDKFELHGLFVSHRGLLTPGVNLIKKLH